MGVRKVSVSLDEKAAAAAERAAAAEGMSLSAWLSRAALRAAKIEDGLRGVAEFEAEYGPIPEEELRKADEFLDRYGIGSNGR
jgi:hypothetical protein